MSEPKIVMEDDKCFCETRIWSGVEDAEDCFAVEKRLVMTKEVFEKCLCEWNAGYVRTDIVAISKTIGRLIGLLIVNGIINDADKDYIVGQITADEYNKSINGGNKDES